MIKLIGNNPDQIVKSSNNALANQDKIKLLRHAIWSPDGDKILLDGEQIFRWQKRLGHLR